MLYSTIYEFWYNNVVVYPVRCLAEIHEQGMDRAASIKSLTPEVEQRCQSMSGRTALQTTKLIWIEGDQLSRNFLHAFNNRCLRFYVEVHQLSADYWPMPIIGRLFVLVSKTAKMLLTAVHIDDSEVNNDSVISHVSSSTYILNRTK